MAYDLSTYAGRQAARDAAAASGQHVVVDAGGVYNRDTGQTTSGSSGGGGGSSIGQNAPSVSDPIYNTVNGPKTASQMASELQAAGWQGGEDVATAYARTAGGTVTKSSGADPNANLAGGLSSYEQAQVNAFKASSGFSIQQLQEQQRQFNSNLDWQKQMWANQGLPQLEIQQRAQALAEQQYLSQRQLAQANLGLDYAKTAASLGGPSDYFQQSNFLRGAQQTGQLPTFLSALKNNTGLADFTAPTGTAPAVQSMGTLASGLTGGPVGNDQALAAIKQIGTTGAQALAPQSLEQLSPDEMGLFQSGLKASGLSVPSFLDIYKRSRVAQSAAQAA